MKLHLHIGTPKTATTTLQQYIHTNKDDLLEKFNIYCPVRNNANRYDIAALFTDKTFSSKSKDVIKNIINDANSLGATSVVINSEAFYGRLSSLEEISFLSDTLHDFFEAISITVAFKRQDLVANGLYNSTVLGGKTGRFKYPNKYDDFYDYHKMLLNWKSKFPRASFSVYLLGSSHFPDDIITWYLESLGIPEKLNFVSARNTSMAENQIEALRVTNELIKNLYDSNHNKEKNERRWIQDYITSTVEPKYIGLFEKNREKFLSLYEESNKRLGEILTNNNNSPFDLLNSPKSHPLPESINLDINKEKLCFGLFQAAQLNALVLDAEYSFEKCKHFFDRGDLINSKNNFNTSNLRLSQAKSTNIFVKMNTENYFTKRVNNLSLKIKNFSSLLIQK